MNVLFIIPPFFNLYRDNLYNGTLWIGKSIFQGNFNKKLLCSTVLANQLQRDIKNFSNLITISCEEFLKPFSSNLSFEEINDLMFASKLTKEQEQYFSDLILEKLEKFSPDVIIHYPRMYKCYSNIYANVLNLSLENGIFSQKPFMPSIYLDPLGVFKDNFLNIYKNKINDFVISQEQDLMVESLKKDIRDITDRNIYTNDQQMNLIKSKYDKLLLLPLCGSHKGSLETNFNHDFDYVEYVMQNIPQKYGIIVTEHPGDAHVRYLTPWMISYFRNKFPNFIYFGDNMYDGFNTMSIRFFKHINAVINLNSVTGMFAMFWDKYIISMATGYNDWFKDKQGLDNIESMFKKPIRNKNNILYWYITRYVLFESEFLKKGYIEKYLKRKISKFKIQGISESYYDDVENNFEKICHRMNLFVDNYYKNSKRSYRKLFSIKNTPKHVVLNLLGFKISFRKKEIKL